MEYRIRYPSERLLLLTTLGTTFRLVVPVPRCNCDSYAKRALGAGLIALVLATNCFALDKPESLVGALRWYHRWIAELPRGAEGADRTLAATLTRQVACCEPASVVVEPATPRGSNPTATSITQFSDGLPAATKEFPLEEFRRETVGALRWYHRWIAELPRGAEGADCTLRCVSTVLRHLEA